MKLTLGPDAEQMINDQLRTRKFTDAQAVILAGLKSLASGAPNEFDPGEIKALLSEGEKDIARKGTLDADEALTQRRLRRQGPNTGAA